jgi:hypothetical protein
MKATKNPNRVANELLETAVALSKHNLLSAQDFDQIKALCTPPPAHSAPQPDYLPPSPTKA